MKILSVTCQLPIIMIGNDFFAKVF